MARHRLFFFFLCFWTLAIPCGHTAEWPHREIKIKVASSPAFQYDPEWEKDIRDRIIFANQIFEPLFNIHFSVSQYIPWTPEDETRETDLLIEELRSFISLGEDEIVIGFHRMNQPYTDEKVMDIDTVGTAQFFRGFVVIRDPFIQLPNLRREVVLAHELAHLFGAVHVSDAAAIMHGSVPPNPALTLDTDNRKIVEQTRGVDFRKGFESLKPESIRSLILIYESLIRQHPHSDFYYELGRFYQHLGEPIKAAKIWEEAVQYHYENPHIHRALGLYYYQNGHYALAVRELGSAIAHFILPSQKKDLAHALNFLGVAYYEQGNVEQAIFNWLKGLSADPDNVVLQGNLAAAYMQNNNLERGLTELMKLAAKHPQDVVLLSNLGVAYLKNKEFEKAVETFRKALEQRRTLQSAHAEVSENAKEQAKLMTDIPESSIRLNLGAALLELNQYESAIAELEKSSAEDPKPVELHQNLAQAYLRVRRYQDAIKEIQEALRYKKDDPYLYALLGQAYASLGRYTEAVEAARQGLRYTQRDDLAASLHKNIGILFLNQKRYAEALEALRASIQVKWKDAETHLYLGIVYAQSGHWKEAQKALKTALQINPDQAEAKRILDSLPKV